MEAVESTCLYVCAWYMYSNTMISSHVQYFVTVVLHCAADVHELKLVMSDLKHVLGSLTQAQHADHSETQD